MSSQMYVTPTGVPLSQQSMLQPGTRMMNPRMMNPNMSQMSAHPHQQVQMQPQMAGSMMGVTNTVSSRPPTQMGRRPPHFGGKPTGMVPGGQMMAGGPHVAPNIPTQGKPRQQVTTTGSILIIIIRKCSDLDALSCVLKCL